MTAKEELLQIALRLFTEEGYENTGVAKIVGEAKVTKPTLYHHFGNKEGLLSSLIEEYGRGLKEVFAYSLTYEGDIIGALDHLVIAYMHYIKKHPMFFRLYKQLYQSPLGSDSYRIVQPLYDQIFEEVTKFFEIVANHHTGLKGKEVWMSFSLIGLMDTYMLHNLRHGKWEDINENTCRQVAKQFLYGVFS